MLTVRMVLGPKHREEPSTQTCYRSANSISIVRYAQNVDMLHPEASASFIQTMQGMQYQEKAKQGHFNMAALSTKGRIQVQATLSAVKEMAGWTIYGCLFCMIFVLIIPYPKRKLLTRRSLFKYPVICYSMDTQQERLLHLDHALLSGENICSSKDASQFPFLFQNPILYKWGGRGRYLSSGVVSYSP